MIGSGFSADKKKGYQVTGWHLLIKIKHLKIQQDQNSPKADNATFRFDPESLFLKESINFNALRAQISSISVAFSTRNLKDIRFRRKLWTFWPPVTL